MSIDLHGMALVAVVAAVTMLIRFLPFLAFGGGRPTPRFITYLAGVLPCAIMTMLVVYCLRGTQFTSLAACAPQLIAAAVTVGLHLWKHSTLLSIAGGTACYMVLIRVIV